MIDDFLTDLFQPQQPASFGDRFGAAFGPTGGADPMALMSGGPPPMMDVPMPLPRPTNPMMPSPMMPPPAPPMDSGGDLPFGAEPTAGPMPDVLSRMAGLAGTPRAMMMPGGGGEGGEAAPPQSILERMAGTIAGKRFQTALAAGLAGGNPQFRAGAFAKGMGSAMAGGLKSDKDDDDASERADETEYKRGQDAKKMGLAERGMTEREKTGATIRDLHGARTKAVTEGKPLRGNAAWNKPPHERFKDAEKLILEKSKELRGRIPAFGQPAAIAAARAEVDKEISAYKEKVYRRYGFDTDGNDIAPQSRTETPSTDRVVGDREAKSRGLYEGGGTFDEPHAPQTREDFDAIPPGAYFINPADGRTMVKRGGQQP